MEKFNIELSCNNEDGNAYQWLGSSESSVSGTFEKTFEIEVRNDPDRPIIYLFVSNRVAVPEGAVSYVTVLATISNFEIRLIEVF